MEGAAAEVLDIAVVAGVVATAQDIGGAQAMAEGNSTNPPRIQSQIQFSNSF